MKKGQGVIGECFSRRSQHFGDAGTMEGPARIADTMKTRRATSMNVTNPKVSNSNLLQPLKIFNEIWHVDKYIIISSHQEFGMWTKGICPAELKKEFKSKIVERINEILLNYILVHLIFPDQSFLQFFSLQWTRSS